MVWPEGQSALWVVRVALRHSHPCKPVSFRARVADTLGKREVPILLSC